MKCEKVIRFPDKKQELEAICKAVSDPNLESRSKCIIFAKQKKEAIGLLFSFLARSSPTQVCNGLGFSQQKLRNGARNLNFHQLKPKELQRKSLATTQKWPKNGLSRFRYVQSITAIRSHKVIISPICLLLYKFNVFLTKMRNSLAVIFIYIGFSGVHGRHQIE